MVARCSSAAPLIFATPDSSAPPKAERAQETDSNFPACEGEPSPSPVESRRSPGEIVAVASVPARVTRHRAQVGPTDKFGMATSTATDPTSSSANLSVMKTASGAS